MIVSVYSKKDAIDLAFTLLPHLGADARLLVVAPSYREARQVLEEMYGIRADEDARSASWESRVDCSRLLLNGSVVTAVPVGDGSKLRGLEWDAMLLLSPNRMPREVVDAIVGQRAEAVGR